MKHIIFDFDGTLVDSTVTFASAWNTLAKKYQFKEIDLNEIDLLKKLSIAERCKRFNFPLYKLPMILPQFYRLYRQSIVDVRLIDGIKELLNEIELMNYKITIISSNATENILEFLKMNGIDSVSNVLCSSRIFGKDKVIKKFINDANLKKSDLIYIGDEHRDIVACKSVGIPIIWVGWGYDALEVVQSINPDYMVSSPEEIINILSSI